MTTKDDCLRGLREAAEQLGESPTKAQYEALDITPASTTIRRLFGSWNDAKVQAGLETYAHRPKKGGSIQPKPADVSIPDDRNWSDLTPQQRWYYKNRQHRISRKDERRRELRDWFLSYKDTHCSCAECGESHPACLDFHHVESEKTGNVSEMVNDGYSKTRILDEIAICIVLCANCHRHAHYETDAKSTPKPSESRHRGRRRRRVNAWKRASDGCEWCDESRPWCLDFHHTGEKHEGVAQMVSNSRPLDEIESELERCELLCANCHRKVHIAYASGYLRHSSTE